MKKIILGFAAIIMFSLTAKAQSYVTLPAELSKKINNPIKIYLGENSTVMTNENQSKVVRYLKDFDQGTLPGSKNTEELKAKYEELSSKYSRDETYLLMQSIINKSNSTKEVLGTIESYLSNNKVPKNMIDQFVLWHYSLQVADYNQVFVESAKAGPCWASIVGSAGLGAIAGAGLGGIPTAGIGAVPGAIIGGICGGLVGWSNC